jgi:hypothetical protein
MPETAVKTVDRLDGPSLSMKTEAAGVECRLPPREAEIRQGGNR